MTGLTARPAGPDVLPEELERRIALLEDNAECGTDFDRMSYVWLFALGVFLPVVLLAIGWWG